MDLLHSKNGVFFVFKIFYAYVQTQFSTNIKIFCSDNGREYTSHLFQDFLQNHGIIHQWSCPSTPQQNGMAERKKLTPSWYGLYTPIRILHTLSILVWSSFYYCLSHQQIVFLCIEPCLTFCHVIWSSFNLFYFLYL